MEETCIYHSIRFILTEKGTRDMGTKQSRPMTTEWPRHTDGRTEAAQASPVP
jgi:hypothetical protein